MYSLASTLYMVVPVRVNSACIVQKPYILIYKDLWYKRYAYERYSIEVISKESNHLSDDTGDVAISTVTNEKGSNQLFRMDNSLKNLSFRERIEDGKVIRVSLLFITTSFWAAFYVASMAIEVSFSSYLRI